MGNQHSGEGRLSAYPRKPHKRPEEASASMISCDLESTTVTSLQSRNNKELLYSDKSLSAMSLPQIAMDRSKVCFVSLFHLYMEWSEIPSHILDDCLIILNCRKSFFINQCRRQSKSKSAKNNKVDTDLTETELVIQQMAFDESYDFIEWLFTKETKGDLLWVGGCGNKTANIGDTNIDPKWLSIYAFLEKNVNFTLDSCDFQSFFAKEFWCQKFQSDILKRINPPSHYTTTDILNRIEFSDSIEDILSEISHLTNQFSPFCEIINQLSPTLLPMVKWNNAKYVVKTELIKNGLQTTIADTDAQTIFNSFNSISFGLEDDDGFVFLY